MRSASAPATLDGGMASAIESIHAGTSVYTAIPEVESLLDELEWPVPEGRLLDPGAGDGGFLVAALERLRLRIDDEDAACAAVHGYEFHPGAAAEARRAVVRCLLAKGWSSGAAERASRRIVEIRDFLLSPVPVGRWNVIAANPPYWRYANLPPEYRFEFDVKVPKHARGDLMYAYLQRAADIVAPGGSIGIITADRWLLNSGSAELRRRLGKTYTVGSIRRLESRSAFHRSKTRTKGTPARVHPVAIVLSPDDQGRILDGRRFAIDPMPEVEGVPLGDVATVHLAPWLGPKGIFVVDDATGIPDDHLVPCYEPEDYGTDGIPGDPVRWVVRTGREEPPEAVLRHLDESMGRMPGRGLRSVRWLPPEPLGEHLPLKRDGILVPRIGRGLRPLVLPSGSTATNHHIVLSSDMTTDRMLTILSDGRVRAQADAMALRLEDGYRSYTVTLLRKVIVPYDLL